MASSRPTAVFVALASLDQLWKVKGQAKGRRRFGFIGSSQRLASRRSRSLPAHYYSGQEQENVQVMGRKDEARGDWNCLVSGIHDCAAWDSSRGRRTVSALQGSALVRHSVVNNLVVLQAHEPPSGFDPGKAQSGGDLSFTGCQLSQAWQTHGEVGRILAGELKGLTEAQSPISQSSSQSKAQGRA